MYEIDPEREGIDKQLQKTTTTTRCFKRDYTQELGIVNIFIRRPRGGTWCRMRSKRKSCGDLYILAIGWRITNWWYKRFSSRYLLKSFIIIRIWNKNTRRTTRETMECVVSIAPQRDPEGFIIGMLLQSNWKIPRRWLFFFFCSRGFLVGELAISEREKKSTDPEQLLFPEFLHLLLIHSKGFFAVSERNWFLLDPTRLPTNHS